MTVVPSGSHGSDVPVWVGCAVTVGGARVGSGCASARPPAGEMATSRLAFAASNHAMARDLPSPETAMLGFVPPSLPCIGWEEKCPPRFVASTIWSAVVSAQVTCPTPWSSTAMPVDQRASGCPAFAPVVVARSVTSQDTSLGLASWMPPLAS